MLAETYTFIETEWVKLVD